MAAAEIAGLKPLLHRFEKAGDAVFWCACGRSQRQPFCDGAHKGTEFSPVRVCATQDGQEALFCACKRTKTPPYCDGSHNALGAYELDDSAFDWDAAVWAAPSADNNRKFNLDGGCFVLTPDMGRAEVKNGWRIFPAITSKDGAEKLSQYLIEPDADVPQPISFGAAETVLFVANGSGEVIIGGVAFPAARFSAFSVRPEEGFSVRSASKETLRLVATVCPPEPLRLSACDWFDGEFPGRGRNSDQTAREAMGDRHYQVLTSRESGGDQVTQFIGGIPKSRAAPHRHLYEETLLILTGDGVMWTENRKAPVKTGDVIYLPRKQLHSLECTSTHGMTLAGSFFPAGSPAINY